MNQQIKAKIIDILYNKKENVFELSLENNDSKKVIGIVVKGADWGINKDVSDDIIKEFCQNMKGKEKNINITVENKSIVDTDKNEKGLTSQEDIDKINENLNNYPIEEMNRILCDREMGENES
jgi:hypothetical protein